MNLLAGYLPGSDILSLDDLIQTDGFLFLDLIRDFGCVGDDSTDNRVAITAARAAVDASTYGGAIYIPRGKFRWYVTSSIDQIVASGASAKPCLWIGEGIASQVVMAGNGASADKRLFAIKSGAKNQHFRNFEMHSVLTNEAEQQHLLHWENPSSSTDTLTGRSSVIDMYFGHVRGDQMRFLGNDTKRVRHILIERCYHSNNSNAVRTRSAVSFQRAADDVTVSEGFFDGPTGGGMGSLEMEPTGTGSNERNMFLDNHFVEAAPTLTGNGSGQEHLRSHFSGNTCYGLVSGLNIENMIFSKNVILNQAVATGQGCIALTQRLHACSVTDNICQRTNDTGTPSVLALQYQVVGDNRGLVVAGNLVENETDGADGGGIDIRPGSRGVVRNNLTFVKVGTASKGFGIRIEAPVETVADWVVDGNLHVATHLANVYASTFGGGNYCSMNNLFRNVTHGQQIAGTQSELTIVTRNMLMGSSTSVRLVGPTYVCVDGAPGPKGVGMYMTTVDPEGSIPAWRGSIALRTSGGGAGTTAHIKEGSDGLSADWTPLA